MTPCLWKFTLVIFLKLLEVHTGIGAEPLAAPRLGADLAGGSHQDLLNDLLGLNLRVAPYRRAEMAQGSHQAFINDLLD